MIYVISVPIKVLNIQNIRIITGFKNSIHYIFYLVAAMLIKHRVKQSNMPITSKSKIHK